MVRPLSLIDPSWSVPINTALLILYAVVNRKFQRRVERKADFIKKEVVDVKLKCGANSRDEDAESAAEVIDSNVTPYPDGERRHRRWTDKKEGDR